MTDTGDTPRELPRWGQVARSICWPLLNGFGLLIVLSWIDGGATWLAGRDTRFLKALIGDGIVAEAVRVVVLGGIVVMAVSGLVWWQAATAEPRGRHTAR